MTMWLNTPIYYVAEDMHKCERISSLQKIFQPGDCAVFFCNVVSFYIALEEL